MSPLTNADLHSHSRCSDGTLSPGALAERAHAQGVQLWALTDHDELAGLPEAAEAAHDLGLDFLTGVELSVSFAGETVHIVGLGFDADHPDLAAGVARTRGGRIERARAMAEGLARAGHPGAFEGALAYTGNPDLIARTHFARWLIETGVCSDMGMVFRNYLKPGKPGYVPHQWAGLGDAVRWITAAGGMAVIAHPGRYPFSPSAEYALFSEFHTHGGRGVEVLTGSHGQADTLKYTDMAREFGLAASRGSDFHSPEESRTDLGALPDLPGTLTPVWMALAHRVNRTRA
ncbi:3',5'-nucleoside bisphosphate phosphatase [Ideonella sp. DXS22W]|uniref:3',5'-nucleoside bisphosphate phosphatase n=1 Tax=Pseudaquabacterium inlustre TaxID=2984192 RepID=A0ABU9CAD7_9BURK